MKSMRMLFVLAASMTSVIANAMDSTDASSKNNSEFVLNFGKYATIGLSLTPSEKNNNFLHNLLAYEKFFKNENAKLRLTLDIELGFIRKDEDEGILRAPYNKYEESKARKQYGIDAVENMFDETLENLSNTVLNLLSQKNDDGKTPLDLLAEKNPDIAAEIQKDIQRYQNPESKKQLKDAIKMGILQRLL